MRSFFKKPAWATTDNDEPSAPEFYRRSQQTYNDILKARKQQRHEEAAKSALRASTESKIPPNPSSKRRRISDPDEDEPREEALETDNEPESPSSSTGNREGTTSPGVADQREVSRHVDFNASDEGFPAVDGQGRNSPEVQVVETVLLPKRKSPSPILSTNPSNSHSISKESSAKEPLQPTNPVDGNQNARDAHHIENNAVKKEEDPTVEILVTSALENTKSLVVYRRMSQRFRDVRLAWCERQGFDNRMTSSVYLTWNKRRLFDVTTCRSLDYSALASLSDNLDLEDDAPLRVHVEAVTDELLRSRAEQLTRNTAADEDEYELEEETQTAFHIVLKSQDRGDMRVKVLTQTTVLEVITNFKKKRKISPDREVSLSFDGDLLDPASQLKDYDVADLDLVDVFVR
jgi:Ubiquitin-2 like Rad60 SUMO-like